MRLDLINDWTRVSDLEAVTSLVLLHVNIGRLLLVSVEK